MDTSATLDIPPLKGLVLAGGRSTRMGQDKGLMLWHGRPQRLHLVALLEEVGIPAYLSCRPEQAAELAGYRLVVDRLPDAGPLGALYSAFCQEPQTAWLAVACDMPLIDAEAIRHLIAQRRPESGGTAYHAPAFDDGSPDPLFAIWEPIAFNTICQRIQAGQRCARKALQAAGAHIVENPRPEVLANANTPQEALQMLQRLGHTTS
ncbi:MAG: NTP transferase domain-containing protein [Saprospiraceae bacterium]|nr:NTP transferase domain-containing protein [Saprospiraceae bacterium]MDW8230526.1 NTP transferase domain-containing protein [Saprospiraceae bacterium]